jgi:aspartate/methionine/tyrosine aminotransferase
MNVEVNLLVAGLEESTMEIVDNEIKRMECSGVKDMVSLGVGEPYFDTPEFIKQAAIRSLGAGNTEYQPTFGKLDLRKAIQEKLSRENQVHSSEHLQCLSPKEAFYWFVSYDKPIKSLDLARDLLATNHLATVPAGAFGLGGENHLRLSYATSEEHVIEGLRRLKAYFDQTGN